MAGRGCPRRSAAVRGWESQWGAELVASFGTMLPFTVARQPAPGDPGFRLALELLAVGGGLQLEPWALALALTSSDAWFLHDRPKTFVIIFIGLGTE
jgi:hypothetical protein